MRGGGVGVKWCGCASPGVLLGVWCRVGVAVVRFRVSCLALGDVWVAEWAVCRVCVVSMLCSARRVVLCVCVGLVPLVRVSLSSSYLYARFPEEGGL